MDPVLVLLRLIHIVLGVFWAGTIFFFVSFLEPSVRAAGPEGGKVMFQLFSKRYLEILPAIAALAILAGAGLLWKVSGGFNPQWMGSRTGITLSIGALSAIVGFGIGVGVMRPIALRMLGVMRALPQADDASRPALMEEMSGLRTRARGSARWVAAFLFVATAAMAIARYL